MRLSVADCRRAGGYSCLSPGGRGRRSGDNTKAQDDHVPDSPKAVECHQSPRSLGAWRRVQVVKALGLARRTNLGFLFFTCCRAQQDMHEFIITWMLPPKKRGLSGAVRQPGTRREMAGRFEKITGGEGPRIGT